MKKTDILNALTIVKPGLSNKDVIEQSSSFAFIDGCIVTYNDEISISHPIEGLDIEGAIKAEILYGLLSKVKEEDFEMKVVGNEIQVSSKRMKAGITLQEKILLPLEEIASKSEFKKLPSFFGKFLSFAANVCGSDMSEAKLTCVHITKDGKMQASDSFKIAQVDMKKKMPVDSFLLPATSARIVSKLNPTHISEGNGWIHFKTEAGTIISCRTFEDEYPVIKGILQVSGEKVTFPISLLKVLDKAGVFTKRDHIYDESVEIQLKEKRLIVKASSDNGWFEESLNMGYSGAPLEFKITPYLLKDILAETSDCIIGSNRLRFETEDWIYISALKNI